MDEIAARAGLSRRTRYNIYPDKGALFTAIVSEVTAYAERFAETVSAKFLNLSADEVPDALLGLGGEMARAILRPEIIALRRLLIRDAPLFPLLAGEYYRRAPGRVMDALADGFGQMSRAGLLRTEDPRRAAEHFAYLVVGAELDRAMLLGTVPPDEVTETAARSGVETFLARYGA